jgi:hypothetical protein
MAIDGSMRKMGDGAVHNRRSDRRSLVGNVGSKTNKEVMWSSLRRWLGWRRSRGRRRRWGAWRKMSVKKMGSCWQCGRRLNSRSTSNVDDVEAEVSASLDGNWRAWWRLATVNSVKAARASRVDDGMHEEEGKVKWYFSMVHAWG